MNAAFKFCLDSHAMAGENNGKRCLCESIHTLGSKAAKIITLKICTIFKYCIYRNKHIFNFIFPFQQSPEFQIFKKEIQGLVVLCRLISITNEGNHKAHRNGYIQISLPVQLAAMSTLPLFTFSDLYVVVDQRNMLKQ